MTVFDFCILIYAILYVVEIPALLIFMYSLIFFVKCIKEKKNINDEIKKEKVAVKILRLITSFILFIIYISRIILSPYIGMSSDFYMLLSILWFIWVLLTIDDLRTNCHKQDSR